MNRWLAAVGSSEDPLATDWIVKRPDLLTRWPILGGRNPKQMTRGDLLVYYAASHQKLIGIARASGDPSSAEGVVPVQVLLAIPQLQLAPESNWDALGLQSAAIKGWRAIHLTDGGYKWAWEALVARTKP